MRAGFSCRYEVGSRACDPHPAQEGAQGSLVVLLAATCLRVQEVCRGRTLRPCSAQNDEAMGGAVAIAHPGDAKILEWQWGGGAATSGYEVLGGEGEKGSEGSVGLSEFVFCSPSPPSCLYRCGSATTSARDVERPGSSAGRPTTSRP